MIVGGGVAGLYAALCAAAEGEVLLLSKSPLHASTSTLAQGGIAAALADDDSPDLHAEDTLRAGRGLGRPTAVAALVSEAAARVRDLAEVGVEFAGDLGREGGHCRRRVSHVGGAATGDRICRILAERVYAHPRIHVSEEERVVALWTSGDRCVGVRTDRGRIAARATLLATGGYGALWARTTNPAAAVGDGIVLAFDAGAAVADLELVQFHPTVLAGNGLLLSEALRGEGAVLLDGRGSRFTDELAPRDVVARAIAARGSALLDLRPVERKRFPALMERLTGEGFDPARQPVPVTPAAHYTMGGIVTDLDGRTEVASLYAAGECACTGVHGANRLASNSLLECLVFSRRAALAALREPDLPRRLRPAWNASNRLFLAPVTPALRRAMWRHAGIIRDAAGLERLRRAPHLLARLIAESALARTESRGGHFRSDYPIEEASLARHTVLRPGRAPEFQWWS